MITPMFLMPGREEGPSINQIKLTWYMDGQYVARYIFDASNYDTQICMNPVFAYAGEQNSYAIETENLTYPIPGFDGWIGPNNQPYQNVTVQGSNTWQRRDLDAYPLFGSKGVYAMDRNNTPNRQAVSAISGMSNGQLVWGCEYVMTPPHNIAGIQNEPHPHTILKEDIPYADINPSARWIAMTVELS